MVEYRRLPLEKLKNCRDLGGYAAGDGKITAYRRFFRSEIPRNLSSRDKDFLLRAGLTDVMDFRGADELERIPNDLRNLQGIKYHWCPMYSKQVAPTTVKEKEAKEEQIQQALLTIKNKYGKNAVLRGMNFREGATARDRNNQIGGHKA